MKIKKLKINGYKNLNIDLTHQSDIIAAIGNNGSGKSNLLEALCYIFRSLYDDKKYSVDFDYDITFVNSNNKTILIKKEKQKPLMFVNDTRQILMDNYLPKRVIIIYSGEEDRLWKNCVDPFYLEYIKNINKAASQGISTTTELLPKILYLNKFYWHIALLSLVCSDLEDNKLFIKNILKISKIEKIKFDFKRGNYDNYSNSETLKFIKFIEEKNEYTFDEFIIFIENKYKSDDIFKYLYTAYTPKGTKILDDITIIFNGNLNIEDLSEGEKKLLLIKAALEFAGQEDCLFILDEPDAHIHVVNKEEILKMFDPYKKNRQIVFTTHSPTITNCLYDDCLYLLDDGKLVKKEKQEKLNHLIGYSWSNHEMGAFLANKKNMILLVEGKHDKIHISTALHKLKDEYPTLDFAIYSMGGGKKMRPFMIGLYEMGDFSDKTYIALFDNDQAGLESYGKGFKEEPKTGYKKLYEISMSLQDHFFALILPKPNGFTSSCTIENMFDASKYEEAYKEAIDKTIGHFTNKSIADIHEDVICKSKNILAEKSKDFSKEDFKHFRPLLNLLLEIQNRKQQSIQQAEETIEDSLILTKNNNENKEKRNYYSIEARGVKAKGYLFDESKINQSKIVVCKDSEANLNHVSSCLKPIVNMRNKLIEDKTLKLLNDRYIFTKDHKFNSVSTAGSVILGRTTNGRTVWKNEKGEDLNEIFKKDSK
ncbi:DNA replication and repair protein RecF [termite gut metagenome]|uniref:DNA replication and repair protein RecF n=1 Tax=termite gut metagenome TaxID=433724 RepID=A0A5J4QLL7_9ZZZZ